MTQANDFDNITQEKWEISIRATYLDMSNGWLVEVLNIRDIETQSSVPFRCATLDPQDAHDLFALFGGEDLPFANLPWSDPIRSRGSQAFAYVQFTALAYPPNDESWCMYSREAGPNLRGGHELGHVMLESDAYTVLSVMDALSFDHSDWEIGDYYL